MPQDIANVIAIIFSKQCMLISHHANIQSSYKQAQKQFKKVASPLVVVQKKKVVLSDCDAHESKEKKSLHTIQVYEYCMHTSEVLLTLRAHRIHSGLLLLFV